MNNKNKDAPICKIEKPVYNRSSFVNGVANEWSSNEWRHNEWAFYAFLRTKKPLIGDVSWPSEKFYNQHFSSQTSNSFFWKSWKSGREQSEKHPSQASNIFSNLTWVMLL